MARSVRVVMGDITYEFDQRTGSTFRQGRESPFDYLLVRNPRLQRVLQKEAKKISKAASKAYARYRTITWTSDQRVAQRLFRPLGNFKVDRWKVAQAWAVSQQTLEGRERERKRRGGRNEDATIFVEKRSSRGRNAFLRVTR